METKVQIRKRVREYRNGLSSEQVKELSKRICDRLVQLSDIQRYDIFFIYSATQNEVDLKEIMHYALRRDTNIAFPKVDNLEMDFYKVTALSNLRIGSYGILEPDDECVKVIPDKWNKICMLVPGVAFSESGFRIGYGKGYYDRFLAKYPHIHTIGIAYESQICAEFEHNEFDIPVDRLITEEREVTFNDRIRRVM